MVPSVEPCNDSVNWILRNTCIFPIPCHSLLRSVARRRALSVGRSAEDSSLVFSDPCNRETTHHWNGADRARLDTCLVKTCHFNHVAHGLQSRWCFCFADVLYSMFMSEVREYSTRYRLIILSRVEMTKITAIHHPLWANLGQRFWELRKKLPRDIKSSLSLVPNWEPFYKL